MKQQPTQKQKKILIIDDDFAMMSVVRDGLQAAGYGVSLAQDGLQGVLLAHENAPDVILLDFNMPVGNGASVYERLRNSQAARKIPVVFTTGIAVDDLRTRIQPGPHTYFLKKPASIAEIKTVIEQVLAGTRPVLQPSSPVGPVPGGARPPQHEFQVRVSYADTDKMGVIYYANYFKYFEYGRTEFMRSLGVVYRDLEENRKLFLPVTESHCQFIGASHYDNLLVVRTRLERLGHASVTFGFEIYNRDEADRLVARGYTRHALVNERWQPTRVPDDLEKLLKPYVW